MQLVNATNMSAGYTMGMQVDGRELLVVVVKGTFTIPPPGEEPLLAEEQVPVVETDVFTGEPGFSAPLYEIDFAARKPRCDVLLNGSAFAPNGIPAERVPIMLRVGDWQKSFYVVGNRVWQRGLSGFKASKPEPFTKMPFSYNNAFGGIDRSFEEEKTHRWYPTNHAGIGYYEYLKDRFVIGKPLPNTEEIDKPITKPNGKYQPMALGPIGRAWQQRVRWAGTYDQNWMENVSPFLPEDFRDEYYQAAPEDQWIDYPGGGEEVELVNLTPKGKTAFKIPVYDLFIEFYYKNKDRKKVKANIDTLLFEPDLARFTLCWRVCLPLRRNMHEMRLAVAGRMPGSWSADED